MLRNFCDEDYLKGFLPGLENYLWTAETNYNKQKEKAEEIVFNDLDLRGLKSFELMPELFIRTSGTAINNTSYTGSVYIPTITVRRLVIDVVNVTGDEKTITLQGSNDNENWNTVITQTVETTDIDSTVSKRFTITYKYYRIFVDTITGILDFKAYLTENSYDLLFAYKWIELILRDAKENNDDQYGLKEIDFRNDYNSLLQDKKYNIDTNSDGVTDNQYNTNEMTLTR